MQRLNELAALPSFPLLDVYLRTFQPPGKRLQNEPRKWTVDEQGRMYATGKRKTAVARVWIKKGDGRFMVNEKVLSDYFPRLWHIHDIVRPFEVTHSYRKYDVWCTVQGGGKTGQAQAIRHGLSVALKRMEPSLKLALKSGTHKPRIAFAALLTHFFFSFSFFFSAQMRCSRATTASSRGKSLATRRPARASRGSSANKDYPYTNAIVQRNTGLERKRPENGHVAAIAPSFRPLAANGKQGHRWFAR